MATKIQIKHDSEKLTSNSGLAIVVAIIDNTELKSLVNVDNPGRKGQQLVFPEYEIDMYWCTLADMDEKEVIHLYHDHGTSEQFHSELKTDMDIERLPSCRFTTNSLILTLGMLSYNVLRIIGQHSLIEGGQASQTVKRIYRKKVSRRRIRTVMQDMIYLV